ncbi:hypothetical protein PR202_gb06678 [Eleusine coracana subsp. coracana]|uniref:Uncharacterized protein n=1 Tax=Eleusine coracana subsp. coracana TaxID=191504 RepID=A0AAV5EA61_ELECO|nr:hypothetical protein PR202_gb06678 [Eleusine coracana subsp. coracana]
MHAILAGIPPACRPAAIIAGTCALLLLATALLLPRAPPPALPDLASSSAAVRLDARVERRSGNEVLWQLPPAATPPRAVLFAAPGCTIRATDFFDTSPGCPRCSGLPEERRFTRAVLARGYAVLVVSSRAECWSLDDAAPGEGEKGNDSSELAAVASIIKWWTQEKFPQLAGLPLVGIGASSGGYFVSALAAKVRFSSIAVMIAEGVYGTMGDIPTWYPPALFMHMPKDAERARDVAASIGTLKAKRVDVREIKCDQFAVSAEFLAERVPGLTRAVADALVDVLRRKGFVDEKGFLKKDGRRTPWKKAAEEAKVLPEGFRLERHVTEELNLAFAFHEFTSLKNAEIFEWFESHFNH